MDLLAVRWTPEEYTLNEYISKFSHSFPNVIKITEGFLGKQEIDSISSSTVIRTHSLYTQRRVVVESRMGKLFSIPIKLKRLKFIVSNDITGSSPHPMTLQEILSKYVLPVGICSCKALFFKEKRDDKIQDEIFSELMLKDTYEEEFLLGHPIDKGKIFTSEPIMIPMYMSELKLVVALGFVDQDTEGWTNVCKWLTKQVNNNANVSNVTFEEIYLLDKKDLCPRVPQYSTIEPIYVNISEWGMYDMLNQAGTAAGLKKEQEQRPSAIPAATVKILSDINDIPKDLHDLTVHQVCECLNLLNMNQYVEAFKVAQVDGQLLYDLDLEMMKHCLRMNGFHIAKFIRFRNGWRPNMTE